MKKFRQAMFLLFCLGAAFLLACSSSSTDPGEGDGANGNGDIDVSPGMMSLKINGTEWTPEAASASQFVPNNVVWLFGASTTLLHSITIVINDVNGISAKGYPLRHENQNDLNSYFIAGYGQVVSLDSTRAAEPNPTNPQGTLNITEVSFTDNYISGTFAMDLFTNNGTGDLISITEGQFNRVPITSDGGPPAQINLNQFTLKPQQK